MSIFDDFLPYRDGNNLMAPAPVPPGTVRGSDNGPMFLSEYYIALNRNGAIFDHAVYTNIISTCIGKDSHLHRAPGDTSQDEIDDHLGVLAGYAEFGYRVNFKLPLALCRFPQLVYAYLLNQGIPSLLMLPLTLLTAGVIAFSCIGTPIDQADPRRLNWLLWQATKRKSILCNLAGMIWRHNQQSAYGSKQVMSSVAAQYYFPKGSQANPFSKYWID